MIGPFQTAIIVQARMTSTRLPGKVLKPVLGKPLLTYLIERLRRAKTADGIVIATTVNAADEPIVELCENLNVPCFRGSEEDVLGRYFLAAKECGATRVVRVTSDCPLLDPSVLDAVVGFAKAHPEFAYVTNSPEDDALRTYPRGLDVETVPFAALREACEEASEPFEREHVMPFFKKRPDRYPARLISYAGGRVVARLPVDTPEDFELVKRILETLYPSNKNFTFEDVIHVLRKNPGWECLNSHVEQKKL